jgi:subtilisin family serine protease
MPHLSARITATMLCAATFVSAASATQPRKPAAKPQRTRVAHLAAPNDPLWRQQWGLLRAGGARVWRWGHGSPRVVVAVLDTGIDPTQPDLRGRIGSGWNALTGTSDTLDDNGHGTRVAGIIAARGDNGIGLAGYCWTCSIMPVKVLAADGHGSGEAIAAGIRWAATHGATVINMSFVLDQADAVVAGAVAAAVARGAIVVAAAGNVGGSDVRYPGGLPGVISVGGVDRSSALYPWSTYGPWTSVAAPGCNETTVPGNAYEDFCGSSSAAAVVSGLVALAASDAPRAVPNLSRLLAATAAAAPVRRVDAARFLAAARKAGA